MTVLATYKLTSQWNLNNLKRFISANWIKRKDTTTPLVITISDKDESYTSAQRRLYWKWCTEYANYTGDDKDSIHLEFKKKFLVGIYKRDDANYSEMCTSITKLKQSESEHYKVIANHVIKITSITDCSKKQMTEYMNCIYRFCYEMGLFLTIPEDLKFVADTNWLSKRNNP